MHNQVWEMILTDDGTMDTVVKCNACHREYRYTFDSSVIEGSLSQGMSEYNDFVDWALDDATDEHASDIEAPEDPVEDLAANPYI